MCTEVKNNKIHTVYVDGIPCHWQVMYDYNEKQLVCCLYKNVEYFCRIGESRLVAMQYVPHCEIDTNRSEFVNLKNAYGLNEKDMRDIVSVVQVRADNDRAIEMIKKLEKEYGYKEVEGEVS